MRAFFLKDQPGAARHLDEAARILNVMDERNSASLQAWALDMFQAVTIVDRADVTLRISLTRSYQSRLHKSFGTRGRINEPSSLLGWNYEVGTFRSDLFELPEPPAILKIPHKFRSAEGVRVLIFLCDKKGRRLRNFEFHFDYVAMGLVRIKRLRPTIPKHWHGTARATVEYQLHLIERMAHGKVFAVNYYASAMLKTIEHAVEVDDPSFLVCTGKRFLARRHPNGYLQPVRVYIP